MQAKFSLRFENVIYINKVLYTFDISSAPGNRRTKQPIYVLREQSDNTDKIVLDLGVLAPLPGN